MLERSLTLLLEQVTDLVVYRTSPPSPLALILPVLNPSLSLYLTSCLFLQALLSLALGSESREKQLLRRELGAELGSVTDTWRRHLHRSVLVGAGLGKHSLKLSLG